MDQICTELSDTKKVKMAWSSFHIAQPFSPFWQVQDANRSANETQVSYYQTIKKNYCCPVKLFNVGEKKG